MSATLQTHLILIAAQVCFACLPIVGRMAVGHVPPAGIVLVRMVFGAVAFASIAYARGSLRFARRDLPFLALCALLGVAANQELFIQGLARSTAVNASVLGSTSPMFTIVVAMLAGRERITVWRAVGIAVAFAAAAALVGIDEISTSSGHLVGSIMVFVNALSYGTYLVIVKPLAQRTDPFTLLAGLFAFGVPMVAPLGIHAFATSPALVAADYATLAFIVVVPTITAYALVQIALRRAESTLVASYIFLQPVIAMFGAMLVLDEHPTTRFFVFAPIVLAGVWLAANDRGARAARP